MVSRALRIRRTSHGRGISVIGYPAQRNLRDGQPRAGTRGGREKIMNARERPFQTHAKLGHRMSRYSPNGMGIIEECRECPMSFLVLGTRHYFLPFATARRATSEFKEKS